ncbi:hypothetical protein GCM10022419_007170 [Nonomuraea rosea]|uniref:Transposase n=1 Tax=Nonomuraea rosea TaxID=638574 RepID=A0ABP6VB46_9ACTN
MWISSGWPTRNPPAVKQFIVSLAPPRKGDKLPDQIQHVVNLDEGAEGLHRPTPGTSSRRESSTGERIPRDAGTKPARGLRTVAMPEPEPVTFACKETAQLSPGAQTRRR